MTVNDTYTSKNINLLKNAAKETFIEIDHTNYVTTITALTNDKNIREIYNGLQTVPKHVGKHGFEVKVSNIAGEISTPWFGEQFNEDHYSVDHSFHYILEFPDKEMAKSLGPAAYLVIELTVDTRKEKGWREWVEYREKPRYKFQSIYTQMSWDNAESYCVDLGGHLASVLSEGENAELYQVWIPDLAGPWIRGNNRQLGNWSWSNGRTWDYDNWYPGDRINGPQLNGGDNRCASFSAGYDSKLFQSTVTV